MTILALEFSSAQRSVAVLRAGAGSNTLLTGVTETGSVSTKAFEMIESALRQAQLEREQIECLAVGLGPGSYTGIRAAIAVAQGWQFARGIKLVGIGSADAIAARAHTDGLRGRIGVVIDAQRNEWYLAPYALDEGWQQSGPLSLVTQAEAQKFSAEADLMIGPEVAQWFPQGRTVYPHAAAVAALASESTRFVAGEKLEPIYLRETKFVKAPTPRRID